MHDGSLFQPRLGRLLGIGGEGTGSRWWTGREISLVVREHGLVKSLVRPDAGRFNVFGRGCAV